MLEGLSIVCGHYHSAEHYVCIYISIPPRAMGGVRNEDGLCRIPLSQWRSQVPLPDDRLREFFFNTDTQYANFRGGNPLLSLKTTLKQQING